MIARLAFDKSELMTVPAIHGRSLFAEAMNRLCLDEATRPDAIAVELSHDACAAVASWIRELHRAGQTQLPCMLGLIKRNSRVHPRHRDATIRLQEIYRRPLHEIPHEVLNEKLNFSSSSLLCLSATDSIIEGVRTAVELGIPVFGIDLGEIANAERESRLIPDPVRNGGGVFHFPPCDLRGDPIVDGRREWAMAARLKQILGEYRRVLFTCGLGHWSELCRLLEDQTVPPAVDPSRSEGELFTRVVVSPSIALRQMDLFPDITELYELRRGRPPADAERAINYTAMAAQKLRLAVEAIEPRDRHLAESFLAYLGNFSLLHQRHVPDLFQMLHAASAMISPAFAETLGQKLVFDALKWLSPRDHPELPHLYEIPADSKQREQQGSAQRVQLRGHDGTSGCFFLSHRGGHEISFFESSLPPLTDPELKENGGAKSQFFSWVWPPCETLLFGTAYEGAQTAVRSNHELRPEPFAGALHAGLDIKATLRAAVRGEKRVQVKVHSRAHYVWGGGGENDEPAVFIFENESAVSDGRWETMLTCYGSDVRQLVRNKERFDTVAKQGEDFIASVTFSTDRQPPPALKPHVTGRKRLYGTIIFGNPCLNPTQAARWLEASDYSRCPILRQNSMGNLCGYYERKHDLVLERPDWTSTLIQLALPYARNCVVILHAPNYLIPPHVLREASRRKIKLETIPLSGFPPQRIETIRNQYLVRPIDVDAMKYSPELAAAFGETATAHLDLLPEHIRAQLHPHK